MRIFAFGGSRYAERARVGAWPEDFSVTGEFEDTYSLPFGRGLLSYGAGVRDGQPFLIVRQRQNEDDRGGYAYTVLLDPGEEAWERFGFNPARLLLAMQQHASFWSELLTTPNVLATPAIVAERIGGLAEMGTPAAEMGTPAICETTQAHMASVPISAFLAPIVSKTSIHLSHRDLGWEGRIGLAEMAQALDALPRALRIGLGWLVGGRPGTGPKFGCRLIVDDISDEPIAGAEAAMALGADAAGALDTVQRLRLSETLPVLLDTPAHKWTTDPERLVDQCRVLAALAAEGFAGIDNALSAITPDDVLYADVRRAASSAIAAGSVAVPASVSEWALAAHGAPALVPRELVHRTDAATLARYLNASGITLASADVKHYALPPEAALDVWAAQIAGAVPEHSPDLLDEGLRHLLTRGLSQAVVVQRVTRLAQAAVTRGSAGAVPLRTWLRFAADARVWNVMGALVSAAARARVEEDGGAWALDYVLCAQDAGAEWLRAQHGIEAVGQAITTALAHIRDRDAGAAAREWLDSLASSRVRSELDIHVKLRIADAAEGRWLALSQLCHLLRGERFLPGRRPDESEARALTAELRELVSGKVHGIPPSGASIDLERIAFLLGESIPGDIADTLGTTATLDASAVKWLHAQSHVPAYEAVARRDWRTLPRDALEPLRAPAVVRILEDVRSVADSTQQLRDVRLLCDRMPHDALVEAAASRADVTAWLGSVAGDARLDSRTSDAVLAAMPQPLRTSVITHLLAGDRKRFEDMLAKLLAAGRPPAIGIDLFNQIAGDPRAREEIARSLLGQSWANASATIKASLCRRPGRAGDEDAEPGRAAERHDTTRGSRWAFRRRGPG